MVQLAPSSRSNAPTFKSQPLLWIKRVLTRGTLSTPSSQSSLEDVVRQARGRNLFLATDVDEGILEADLIFVSVNTPTKKSGVGAGFATDLKDVKYPEPMTLGTS